MARLERRLAANAPGQFYVDSSCIDCDTCRWMAPGTFGDRDDQAYVHTQPSTDAELRRAELALLSCPTSSIGTHPKRDLSAAQRSLPDPIADGVYHCGYHSEASFGATSYLVQRPDGNVLVDSPRFTTPLVRRLEEMGGVRLLFLSHRDDVADHRRFHEHFGCDRVIHERDRTRDTASVEVVIPGDGDADLGRGLTAIPTPGHTEGSACLLVDETFLFTGDHLAYSPHRGHLYAFHSACWYDWPTQIVSMRRLLDHRFEWVLPGHGRRMHYPKEQMRGEIQRAVDWMTAQPPPH